MTLRIQSERMTKRADIGVLARFGLYLIGMTFVTGLTVPAAWPVTSASTTVVTHARIRLLPGDLPLAGYFDLANQGVRPVVLIAASSPAFRKAEIHRSMEEGGMSSMVPVRRLEIRAGAILRFSPGGYHLMLVRRVKPLRVGDTVPVTLKFTGAAPLRVMFRVNGADSE